MLFREEDLDGIRDGRITLAFRAWDRPRVRVGTKLRTQIGLVEILSVDEAPRPSEADAMAAGRASVEALRADAEPGKTLYRIGVRFAGDDPRLALRESLESFDAVVARLAGDEKARAILTLIAENPGVVSTELAARMGRERLAFKADVRKLKELGLTESLEVGYRLSPRGQAVLAKLARGPRQTRL